MRAVEVLRQRAPPSAGGTLGYAPVQLSDSEDFDRDDGDAWVGGDEYGEGRRRRVRRGVRQSSGEARRGEGDLWPHYTPLYTNMKQLRRKRLDASMMYYRAGPCTKVCFVLSLWGLCFLAWLGVVLARASPYIVPKDSPEDKLAFSHSVFGAAAMYFFCACVSGFSWYKSSYGMMPLPTRGDTSS